MTFNNEGNDEFQVNTGNAPLESVEDNYWRVALHNSPSRSRLVFDLFNNVASNFKRCTYEYELNSNLELAIKEICKELNCSLFEVMYAAFSTLIGRFNNSNDVVIGSLVRQTLSDGDNGFNLVPLRIHMHGDSTFESLAKHAKKIFRSALENSSNPLNSIVNSLTNETPGGCHPIFQIIFSECQSSAFYPERYVGDFGNRKVDISISFIKQEHSIALCWLYDGNLFSEGEIFSFVNAYTQLLSEISKNPQIKIGKISFVTGKGNFREQPPLEFNHIEELFERSAERYPNHCALDLGYEQVTYKTLRRHVNQLANYLHDCGVQKGDIVAIYMERRALMIVSLLAIWKSGAAYLPIEASYPAERIEFIIADGGPKIVLSQKFLFERINSKNSVFVDVDDENFKERLAGFSDEIEFSNTLRKGEDAAYLMYTSGSTGRPKGVLMPHQSIVNLLTSQAVDIPALKCSLKTLQFASLSFDVACQEIMTALSCGGTLYLINEELRHDLRSLAKYVYEKNIECLFFPFPVLHRIASESKSAGLFNGHLKVVITAGEQLVMTDEIVQWLDGTQAQLVNHYGPTETHVVSYFTDKKPYRDWELRPPIGLPIAGVELFVLNEYGALQPEGAAGELCVHGIALSDGYHNLPELTEKKFIKSEIIGKDIRMYRTGDIVRKKSNGEICFLERLDDQVKVRGFRVELGEIELQLMKNPIVSQAVVTAIDGIFVGDKYLAAYIVLCDQYDSEAGFDNNITALLKHALKSTLPDYMIPNRFIFLDYIPLTSNGKIDKRKLPSPIESIEIGPNRSARNNTDSLLIDIFGYVLGVECLGIDDSFFEMGGTSFLVLELIKSIEKSMFISIPIQSVFENPTIETLSDFIVSTYEVDN